MKCLKGADSGNVSILCSSNLGLGTPSPDSQVPVSLLPPRVEGEALGAFLEVEDEWGAGLLSSPPKRGQG